ncbi:: Peptidase_C80 [Gemmata massiliana]|uniref:: Peptidase_C80 n=1 Tax=Gemmata massiliana TaxID=1210884 RepID=A0A6P2DD99_9BACT|nr:C80 family cysteine peptidase [Gemmata massiliana]VTR99342.1 : Peptidase_C80 [Gemmata massiliana]
MSKYDGQIVLGFKQPGATGIEIENWVRELNVKFLTSNATSRARGHFEVLRSNDSFGLKAVMNRLAPLFSDRSNIRIYLVGHGGWKHKTLGGEYSNYFITWMFSGSFLKNATNIGVVNLMACELGVGPTSSGGMSDLGVHSTNSFASEFHRKLKEKAGIATTVHAYPTEVKVRYGGMKSQFDPKLGADRRMYKKHIYYWSGDQQMFRGADYTADQRPE